MKKIVIASIFMINSAYAAHPLVTDDTGTQGKGKWQYEINTDRTKVKDNGDKLTYQNLNNSLTYGIVDNLDFAINLPYTWNNINENPNYGNYNKGFNDISAQFKWNFFTKDKLSLALRPVVSFPTGNSEKGLGNTKSTQSLNLLAQYDNNDWAILFNTGLTHNNNSIGDRKYLWNASLAFLYNIGKNTIALDGGVSRNPVYGERKTLTYALIGDIYHLNDNLDLDIGYRRDFADKANTIGVGLTKRW